MLAHGLPIRFIELGVAVFDDLAHLHLGQFLGHQLIIEEARVRWPVCPVQKR